jgi:probable rRNA maturation factor
MSVRLVWSNEQNRVPVTDELIGLLERLLSLTADMEQIREGEVALSFVDDDEIHRLNREFRQVDRPTDVLSFPMRESAGEEPEIVFDGDDPLAGVLGDIVISLQRAKAQSEEYGHSLEREIGFLFVHGLLHLLGYDHDHEAAEQEMFAKQEAVLAEAGLAR